MKKCLTDAEKSEFLERLAEGEELSSILKSYAMRPYSYAKFLESDTHFRSEVEASQAVAMDLLVEKLKVITDDCQSAVDASAARVLSDNIKWLASKLNRKQYGEKMEVNMHQTLDISDALLAARSRLTPILHQQTEQIDVTPVVSIPSNSNTTGHEPVAELTRPSQKPESFDDLL